VAVTADAHRGHAVDPDPGGRVIELGRGKRDPPPSLFPVVTALRPPTTNTRASSSTLAVRRSRAVARGSVSSQVWRSGS
jgi:hypothetical protein